MKLYLTGPDVFCPDGRIWAKEGKAVSLGILYRLGQQRIKGWAPPATESRIHEVSMSNRQGRLIHWMVNSRELETT
ncbi:MAG TPA: hypothetical protein VLA64_03310, partial [Azonexus sp.]|nr:hypothetical protein [Azonexus sp.]